MPTFRDTLHVSVSPDKAWSILGELTLVDQWIPGITRVEVDRNQHRVCTFANGAVQHETILDYSSETRAYRYLIEGSPLPVKNNRGRFAVVTDGPGSVIDWESEFEALDPADEAHISQM